MSYWINGEGPLLIAGKEIGRGEFKILVRADRAKGTLWAEPAVIDQAYRASSVDLRLPDGRDVSIVVTSWTPGQDAEFSVNTRLD